MRRTELPDLKLSACFDREGLAEYLGVTVGWIDNAVCERRIPYLKLGHRTVRFPKDAIQKWLSERTFDPAKEK